MKIFSSFTLKIIAIVTMLMDHIYTYLGGVYDIPIWFGYIGKLSAPIFFYLIVEGFFHTKSRMRYLGRLSLFGIIMIGLDNLLGISNNIFLSLALSILILLVLEYAKSANNKKAYIVTTIIVILLGVAYMFTESSFYGFFMTLIFYFFRERKYLLSISYIGFSILPVITVFGGQGAYEQLMLFDYQWMMVFSLPLILLYNGRLGLKNKFTKWMFYFFYPIHLGVIQIIATIAQ
ncbi:MULTISPECIES: TraX family protein [Clostridium]|uniref:TraX family protein n=1 Tax=Clostridium TaxID=1485 RepID=UPI0029025C15|nr:TraX family protein [Clostridium sp.]MDU1279907.1 TraX family protein [Clostridium sp.]MDU3526035.1 TraX family protein [Clostridium sp.]MDU7088972.1 TraX family protein [Clostridium sp.]MDU7949942.1 TraX family protein [Clostridium sp.]